MLQVLIVIFFILEFVLALALIFQMMKLDMKVNAINKSLPVFKYGVVSNLSKTREFLFSTRATVKKLIVIVKNQRRKYILEMIKNICTMSIFLLSKGKYKKFFIAYGLGKEIVNGIKEA